MPEGLHPFRRRSPLLMAPTSASHPDFPFQPHQLLILTAQGATSIPNLPYSSPLTWLVFRPKLRGGFSLKLSGRRWAASPSDFAVLTLRVHSSIYYLPWQRLALFPSPECKLAKSTSPSLSQVPLCGNTFKENV